MKIVLFNFSNTFVLVLLVIKENVDQLKYIFYIIKTVRNVKSKVYEQMHTICIHHDIRYIVGKVPKNIMSTQ